MTNIDDKSYLDKLATVMLEHGIATGHADTLDSLLAALSDGLRELRDIRVSAGNIKVLTEADNFNHYACKSVMWKGSNIGTVGNLLIEAKKGGAQRKIEKNPADMNNIDLDGFLNYHISKAMGVAVLLDMPTVHKSLINIRSVMSTHARLRK